MSAANTRVDDIARRADAAMRAGQADAAARLWEEILAIAPDHAQAVLRVGQHALFRRDVPRATALLKRAAVLLPNDPVAQLNLAFAHRASDEKDSELAALNAALTIDPYFLPAMLAKAALLERMGKRKLAARVYKDALSSAPPEEHLPAEMRSALAHGRDMVRDNAMALEKFLEGRLNPLTQARTAAELERFAEARDAMAGTKKIYTQRPTLLHFPRLPAIQFYDNADFPLLPNIEAGTDEIRRELFALLADEKPEFKPYVTHGPGVPLNQWAELNFSPRWSAFFFWKDGRRIAENCARCPETAALLERAGMVETPGYAPTAFFSLLEPGTHLPAHTGVTNTRLIVHLPLIVPPGCRFRVGNETREWREGQAWVFDDTIEHEAWNDSDKTRVILIFDVANPNMTDVEKALVGPLLSGVEEYYRSE